METYYDGEKASHRSNNGKVAMSRTQNNWGERNTYSSLMNKFTDKNEFCTSSRKTNSEMKTRYQQITLRQPIPQRLRDDNF